MDGGALRTVGGRAFDLSSSSSPAGGYPWRTYFKENAKGTSYVCIDPDCTGFCTPLCTPNSANASKHLLRRHNVRLLGLSAAATAAAAAGAPVRGGDRKVVQPSRFAEASVERTSSLDPTSRPPTPSSTSSSPLLFPSPGSHHCSLQLEPQQLSSTPALVPMDLS